MLGWITRNPERFIGAVGAIVVLVAQELLTQGVVTSIPSVNLLHFLSVVTPPIVAELIVLIHASNP